MQQPASAQQGEWGGEGGGEADVGARSGGLGGRGGEADLVGRHGLVAMPRLESQKSRRRREVRLGLAGEGHPRQRVPLDAQTAATFFDAIDAKDAPRFGLVKLAALDLDVPHPAPVRAQEHTALSVWAPAITLLGYAALRRTDGIVAALLRAGADPSARWTPSGVTSTAGVRAYAGSLRPSYSAWVARKVVDMRRAGVLALRSADEDAGASSLCSVCGETATQLLAWDGACDHLLCEPCFWRTQMGHDHVACGGREACCPVCAPAVVAATSWLGPARGSTVAARAERKAASAQKWLALAATAEEAEAREAAKPKKKKKGVRIRALPERAAAALNPGWLRGDRVERLNEAACADDTLRLLGILEAGVDVDGRSECGETAALSAAMLGNAASLRVLCWAGADLSISDAGGATPASAAAARGHEAALAVLREFDHAPKVSAVQTQAAAEQVPSFQTLIDQSANPAHPGCGSGYVDNGFSAGWLRRLQDLWARLPAHVADAKAGNDSGKSYTMTCAARSLFCDAEGWVEAELAPLVERLLLHTAPEPGAELAEVKVLPRMRFLCYKSQGGRMQPHV